MSWKYFILSILLIVIAWNQSHAQCNFSISPNSSLCKLSPIKFVPAETKGLAYVWIFGDGDTSTRKSPIHIYDFGGPSTYQVTLILTDTLMNTTTCSQSISLTSANQFIQAEGDTLECDDLTSPDSIFHTTFTITSGGGGNLIWDWGDGSSSTTSASLTESHTYTTYGTFYLTITAEGASCPSFVQRIRSFGQASSEIGDAIGGIDNTLCEGESICLWNESEIINSSNEYFVWTWRDGLTDTVYDANPRCFLYEYEDEDVRASNREFVMLEALNGCFSEDTPEYSHIQTTQITIFALPRADFDAPDVVCIVDSTICFANQSFPNVANRPYEYEWDFGDTGSGANNISELAEPCHTFSGPGTYLVELSVSNGCGTDIKQQDIDILPQPIANAQASDTTGCGPLTVSFDNLSTPLATLGHFVRYDWKVSPETGFFIDTSANFFEPSITFFTPERYEVTLIVVTECDSVTWSDSIIVGRSPTVDIKEISDTCNVVNLLPEAMVEDFGLPITQYTWTFMDGTPTTSNEFPLTDSIFFGEGNHQIVLQVENECGTETDSELFNVASLETVEAGTDLTICINTPVALGGTPQGGRWECDGLDLVDENGIFRPTSEGVFQLCYKIGRGVCEVSDSLTITVLGIPDVSIFTPDTAVCVGSDPLTLQVSQPGGDWSMPLSNNEFLPDSVGEFMLVYTFTNSQTSCNASDTVIITVNPLPEICVSDTNFCLVNEDFILESCSNVSGTETWNGPGTTSDGIFNPSLAREGLHNIIYTFTSDEGCIAIDTIVVSVFSANTVEAGYDIDTCENIEFISLTNFTPLGGRWNVDGVYISPDTFLVDLEDILPLPNRTLIYTIGSGSCEVSDSLTVIVRDTAEVNAGDDIILCEDASEIRLIDQVNPTGGIFSGDGILDQNLGTFDPNLVTPGSSYTIQYSVTNADACVSKDFVNILVDTLPVVEFLLPQDSCIDASIPFVNLSTNTETCIWTFGDNDSSFECNPFHIYTDTGTYIVQLTAISANQCQDTQSDTITIYQAPFALFMKNVRDTLCAEENGGTSVNFIDQSIPAGGTYIWDFGNGDTSLSPNPGTVYFAQDTCPITYYITLSIINECGIHSMVDSVTVLPRPQLRWGTNVSTGCSPLEISFNNISLGKPERFEWFVDGVSFSQDSIPDPRFFFAEDRDSIYTILLVGTNSCGTDSLSHAITVKPNTINPFFNSNMTEGCMPLEVQFTDYSNAPFVSWDFGDGSVSEEKSPSHTFVEPGTYFVQFFANNGCSFDTGNVIIKVFSNQPAEFEVPDPVCIGDSMFFAPISTDGITAYIWDFGDGDSARSIQTSHVYNSSGSLTVTLTTIADSMACANSWDTIVSIRPLPPAYFSISNTSGCVPHEVTLDNVPSMPQLFYDWNLGDGNASTLSTVNHIYQNTGDYTITLTVEDNFGCQSDTSAEIHVHPLPQSGFSYDRQAYCGGDTVYFQNESVGAMGWEWNFGDATSSTLRNPVKVYDTPGIYRVSLISFNTFNCSDTIIQEVEVLPQSVANIITDNLQGCFPFEANFTNGSQNFSHSFWDFGDQTNTTATNPGGHTFFEADKSYTVTLIVDTAGFCPDTTSIQIDVGSWPESSFAVSVDEACAQETISFTNNSRTDSLPLSFEWQRNGTTFSNQIQPEPMLLTTGIYEMLLIATNIYGCKDSAFHTVNIHPQPVARIEASDTIGCAPLEVAFTNASAGFSRSKWTLETNVMTEETSPFHEYLLSDDSVIVQLVVDTAGFCFDTARQKIIVASSPVSSFEASDLIGCSDLEVTLTSLSQSNWRPISLSWNLNGGNPPFSNDSIVQATLSATQQERTYQIIHRVSNDWGCTDSSSREITVYPQPIALFQALPDSGCSPLLVEFDNLSEDFTGVLWDFGNGIVSNELNPQHIYGIAGDYNVSLIVNYAEICWDSLTVNDLIHVKQSPIAGFTYRDSIPPSGNAKGYVTFENISLFAETYVWDFGDGNGSNKENPTHQYELNRADTAILIAYASNRCTDTTEQMIRFESFGKLFIPNALAPEYPTDPTKEYTVFLPKGIGLAEYEIAIYNLSGIRVWHSTELDNLGSPIEWWDGKGYDRPEVFIWKVHKAIFTNGEPWQGRREGGLTLIR